MTYKTTMLAGAAAIALGGAIAIAPAAMADPIPAAFSYADLLEPVPDALARLQADDAAQGEARMIPAQFYNGHHHHHHHSARWFRRHGYMWNGQVWVMGPPPYWHNHDQNFYRQRGWNWDGNVWVQPVPGFDHHHHHHHHHHQNWR